MSKDLKQLKTYYVVYADGSRSEPEFEASIIEIVVFLRLDYYSYVCLKVANNAPEKRWQDEDISKIGTMIKVKLGWEDELVDIFEGQVFGNTAYYQQTGETVDIYAMCGIARLAHGRKVRGFKEKKDSEIVQEIIKENGLTVGEMDSFGYKHKFTLQREVTDLEYILDIAKKTNTHFWCEGKKFFMKKDPDRGDEDIILEVDKTLFDFRARAESMKLISSVEMTGVNVRSFEKFVGIATHADLKKIGGDQLGCTVVDTEFGERKEQVFTYEGIDQNTVDLMAKDYLQGASMKFIKADIGCQGDPRIVQGILLTLKEHSTRFDGKYFVRQVKHIIDPFGGFVTEFEGFKNAFGKEKASGDGSGAAQAMVKQGEKKEERGRNSGEDEDKDIEFSNMKWLDAEEEEINMAYVGDKVVMSADVKNVKDGTALTLNIMEKDYDDRNDFVETHTVSVKDGKVKKEWKVIYMEDTDDVNSDEEQKEKGYTKPEYVFKLFKGEKVESVESAVLEMKDWIEAFITDANNKPLSNKEYIIILSDGSERKGTLDKEGYFYEENAIPGEFKLYVDGFPTRLIDKGKMRRKK